MYAHLKGTVDTILKDSIVLDVNNVGYEIYMPESEINSIIVNGQNVVTIYTYLHVREDDMKLFGFLSKETLSFFKKLILVSGVGPKMAIGIISNISVGDMCVAIATDNVITLKSIPGVGPKMAQKIIFELKDKVIKEGLAIENKNQISKNIKIKNENESEAITALQVLGYSVKEIEIVISKLDISQDSVENIIRKVLKNMQKN